MIQQFLRLEGRTVLEEGLRRVFEERRVAAGYFRGTGVVRDVELRTFDGREGGPGPLRKLPGTWLLVSLEGTIGTFQGDLSFGLRAVLSREGELGVEQASGELVTAQCLGLEGMLWASEQAIVRSRDETAGIWMIEGSPAGTALTGAARVADPLRGRTPRTEIRELPAGAPVAPRTEPAAKGGGERRKAPPTLVSAEWGAVAEASAEHSEEGSPAPRHSPIRPTTPAGTAPPPSALKPPKPVPAASKDSPIPARGDIVEHFAFGRCEVLGAEGERLRIKIEKSGQIKEIAIEMLQVREVDSATPNRRRFKLERKL